MERISRIRKDSDELNVLQKRIHNTFDERHVSQSSGEAWRQACREFHDSFDRLFFLVVVMLSDGPKVANRRLFRMLWIFWLPIQFTTGRAI